MINGNRIQFGYGDIAVTSTWYGSVVFQQIKPPQECGTSLCDCMFERIGKSISIDYYDHLKQLKAQLTRVKEGQCFEFEFDGYIFDFTNYNEASIQACITRVNGAMDHSILLMAC